MNTFDFFNYYIAPTMIVLALAAADCKLLSHNTRLSQTVLLLFGVSLFIAIPQDLAALNIAYDDPESVGVSEGNIWQWLHYLEATIGAILMVGFFLGFFIFTLLEIHFNPKKFITLSLISLSISMMIFVTRVLLSEATCQGHPIHQSGIP